MQTFKEFLMENTNEEMDFRAVMINYEKAHGEEMEGKFKPDKKFEMEHREFAEELYKATPILSDICYYELDREEIQKKPGMSADEWEREEIIRLYSPSTGGQMHTFLVGLIKALYFDTITRPDSEKVPANIESYLKRFPRFTQKMKKYWMKYHVAKEFKNRCQLDFCKKARECFEDAFWFNIDIFNPFEKNKENMPISWSLRSLPSFLGIN